MAGIVSDKLRSVSGDIPEDDLAVFYRVLRLIAGRLEGI